jgi:hypothetical protein
MGRRILNRKDLRADYDAAEARRRTDEGPAEDEEAEEEDEEEEGEEEEAEAESEGEEGEGGDEEDEEAPPKKKKTRKPAATKEPKKRSRAAKQRMKVVWGVFNNSHVRVATFEYKEKQQAYDHAAKLAAAKNPPQTFFVQPVKEPMEPTGK